MQVQPGSHPLPYTMCSKCEPPRHRRPCVTGGRAEDPFRLISTSSNEMPFSDYPAIPWRNTTAAYIGITRNIDQGVAPTQGRQ